MKKFKLIYYPVLVAAVIAMLVLSFADMAGVSKSGIDANYGKQMATEITALSDDDTLAYITDSLTEMHIAQATDGLNTAGRNTASYATDSSQKPVSTFVVQEAVLKYDELKTYYSQNQLGAPVYSGEFVKNVIVSIPGSTTKNSTISSHGENIVFFVHYDKLSVGEGATDVGANVAAMLLAIDQIKDMSLVNDVTFVFAAHGNDGARGAFAYNRNFVGFNMLASYSDLIVNFENHGTAGTLTLLNTHNSGYEFTKYLNKISTTPNYNSVAAETTQTNTLLQSIYNDKVVVTFGNLGKGQNMYTRNDTAQNLQKSLISQTTEVTLGIASALGGAQLSTLRGSTQSSFSSYLDLFTISTASWVSYVLGGLMVLLLAGFLVANYIFKAYSFKNIAIGALVAAIAVGFAFVGVLVVHYLSALMGAGFGVFSFKAISALSFTNVGAFIAAMLLSSAFAMAAYALFKRMFRVKAQDIVAGNIIVLAVVASIMLFVSSSYASAITLMSFAALVVAILVTVFRTAFKNKFGMDIHRLFPYVWAIIISLPMLIGTMTFAFFAYGLTLYPLMFMLFSLSLGFIAPYFDFLDKRFQSIADKLPQRTLRKYRIVETEIPDPANRKKTIVIEKRENFEEKTGRKYSSWMGVVAIALVGFITFSLTTLIGHNMHSNLSGRAGDFDRIYDDAVVYSVSYDNAGNLSGGDWIIKDKSAYGYLIFSGFDFNDSLDAWVRNDPTSLDNYTSPIITSFATSLTEKEIRITPKSSNAEFRVKLTQLSLASSVNVVTDSQNYTIDITSGSEMVLKGRNSMTIRVTASDSSNEYSGSVEYTEVSRGAAAFSYIQSNKPIYQFINDNFVYLLTCTASV